MHILIRCIKIVLEHSTIVLVWIWLWKLYVKTVKKQFLFFFLSPENFKQLNMRSCMFNEISWMNNIKEHHSNNIQDWLPFQSYHTGPIWGRSINFNLSASIVWFPLKSSFSKPVPQRSVCLGQKSLPTQFGSFLWTYEL